MTALDVAVLVTALAAGLVAGSLFPFSSFVMAGLRQLTPRAGISAMQSINERAVTPVFMILLFGTALAGTGVAVWAVASDDQPVGWLLSGAVVYLVGVPGITIVFNVPLNDRLGQVDPADPGADDVWADYVRRWPAFNHCRVVAGLVASALFTLAAMQ